jgi:excinuclease UvrABC helicase subunit UvrB
MRGWWTCSTRATTWRRCRARSARAATRWTSSRPTAGTGCGSTSSATRIERLRRIDPLTGRTLQTFDHTTISPAKHFVMPPRKHRAGHRAHPRGDGGARGGTGKQSKLLEAQRLRMRTTYDLEMLREVGYCSGIENYSRPLSGRARGRGRTR